MSGRTAIVGSVESSPPVINVALIGVQRSGSSSFAAKLAEHPEICLAKGKEAHLFDQLEVQDHGPSAERLEELFAHRSGERYLLDATPEYIWLPGCLEALKGHCPDVKIIAVLREPAERARSQHALQMGREWETLSFPRALFAERKRLALDEAPMVLRSETRIHSYRTRGYYAHQIAHLLKIFPDALILAFDELLEKPDESLARAYEHLGLELPASSQELERLNAFRGDEFSLTEQILRLWMSRETRKTEKLLGWDRGALKRARSPRTH